MKNATLQYLFPSSDTASRSPLQWVLDFLYFLLFFITPILISVRLKQVFNAPKYVFVGVIAVLAVSTWSIICLNRREIALPRHRTYLFLALLMVWEAITLFRSTGLDLSLREYGVQLALFFLSLVAAANIRDRERIENLLHFAVAAGVIAAGFGILQYYRLDEVIFPAFKSIGVDLSWLVLPQKPENQLKIYSTMGHRNYLAGYLVCLIPIVLGRFVSSVSIASQRNRFSLLAWRQSFVYGSSFFLLFTVVLLTHTRGSWVGLTVGLSLFAAILLFKFKTARFVRGGIVAFILVLTSLAVFGTKGVGPGFIVGAALMGFGSAFLVVILDRRLPQAMVALLIVSVLSGAVVEGLTGVKTNPLNRMRQSAGQRFSRSFDLRYGSAFQRVLIWKTAWSIITGNPLNFLFGTGIGTFGLNYMPYQSRVLARPENEIFVSQVNKSIYSHNEYLHFWSEIGLVGLSLLLASFGTFFLEMARQVKRCEVNYQNLLLVGMVCSTVSVLAHNVFSFSLHLPYTSGLFYCLIAFCLRYGGTPDIRIHWGPRTFAVTQAAVGDGWLGLSLLPLSKGRMRAWAGWVVPASVSRLPDELTVQVTSPGGKTTEKPVPVPWDEALVIERNGSPAGWRMALKSGGRLICDICLDKEAGRPVDRTDHSAWGWAVLLALLSARLLSAMAGSIVLDYHWRNAFLKFRMRRFDEAIIDFKRALFQDPRRGEVLFDFGRALMDSNRNMLAVAQFIKAKKNFVDPANDHNIALCYYKAGNYDMAEYYYRRALALNPIYEQSLSNLAFYLVGKGRFDEAREFLDRGLKYYPKNATFFASAGVMEARLKHFERAEKLLGRALEIDPKLMSARINLATILFNTGRYESALKIYEKLVKDRPRDVLIRRKYLGTLASVYQRRLQKDPNDVGAVRRLALTYADLGAMDPMYNQEAVRLLRAYLDRNPSDAEIRYNLGLALQRAGFPKEAYAQIQAARATVDAGDPLAGQMEDSLKILQLKLGVSGRDGGEAAGASMSKERPGLPRGPGGNSGGGASGASRTSDR